MSNKVGFGLPLYFLSELSEEGRMKRTRISYTPQYEGGISMKFQTSDECKNWVIGMLEKCEVDESEFEDYEPTEEDLAEVKAFEEVMGQIFFNYGRLQGIAKSVEEFGGLGYGFALQECQKIQEEIDIGVGVLERYFERIGIS